MRNAAHALSCLSLFAALGVLDVVAQESGAVPSRERYRHSIEVSPIVPLFGIYVGQFTYRFAGPHEFIVGAAYVNIREEDIGRFHAPTIPVGYRHYLWRTLHVEYQLWPAYNFFRNYADNRIYAGFELYSELRAGFLVDFSIGGLPFFANLQWVFGIPLYPGNKPDEYLEWAEEQPPFHFPHAFLGIRF